MRRFFVFEPERVASFGLARVQGWSCEAQSSAEAAEAYAAAQRRRVERVMVHGAGRAEGFRLTWRAQAVAM